MSAQITVNVAGDERSVPEQTTAADLFEGDRAVLVARVNGELRDLAHVLADGDAVEPVTAQEQDGLDVLRHSAAHVLAQAVQEVNPKARLGIGPPVAQSSNSTVWTMGRFVPFPICVAQPILPVAMRSGRIRSILATLRARSRSAISGCRML